MLIQSPGGRTPGAALTDATGNNAIATLTDGAEVEILAWQPLGPGGMRYRVQPIGGSVEGWLSATHLRAPVIPPPPPVVVAPSPPPVRQQQATPRKVPAVVAVRSPARKVKPAVAKPAVKKKTRRAL